MRIASPYSHDDVRLGPGAGVLASGFARISTLETACRPSGQLSLKGRLSLATMNFGEGAVFAAAVAGDRGLELWMTGPASVQVAGPDRVEQDGRLCAQAGAAFVLDAGKGDRAELIVEAAPGAPGTAKPGAASSGPEGLSDFLLSGIAVDDLRFLDGAASTASGKAPDSSVVSGELMMEDTGESVKLQKGDELKLDVAGGTVESLAFDKGDLAIEFRGRVHSVTLGPAEDRRDLRPTLLGWLRHSEWVTASLTVLGAILLFLWSLREWRNKPPVP